jgi:low temperature requirement protein LtrA
MSNGPGDVAGGSMPSPTPTAPVGFLELFYDLVFVATTMVLSNEFSRDPSWYSAAWCLLTFTLLWLLWLHTTILMNVERRDDLGQRGLVFAQMFFVFLVVLAFVDRREGSANLVGFWYMMAILVVAYAHHRIRKVPGEVGSWAVTRRNRLVFAGVAMGLAIFIPNGPDWILFGLAIVALVVPTSIRAGRGLPVPEIDVHHLTERAALLTLVMFGEAFVKVALVVSDGSLGAADIEAILVMFVILLGLFSTYFDDVPRAGIRPGTLSAELWLLAHLVMQIGIVTLAIGDSKFVTVGSGHVHDEAVVLLALAFVGIYGGLALIGLLGDRTPRGPLLVLRLSTAAIATVALLVVWWVVPVHPVVYVVLLAVLSVGHSLIAWKLRARTTVFGHGHGVAPPASPSVPPIAPEIPNEL